MAKTRVRRFDDGDLVGPVAELLQVDPAELAGLSPNVLNAILEKCGAGPAEPDAGQLAEMKKVKAFAERPEMQHALRAKGETPQQYVAKFSELRKKRPTFTAADYGAA